jgi:hypothetical protein
MFNICIYEELLKARSTSYITTQEATYFRVTCPDTFASCVSEMQLRGALQKSVCAYCYILLSSVIPKAICQRQSSQALTDLQVRQRDVQFQVLSLNRLRKSEKHLITHCGENNTNDGLFLLLY